MTIKVAVLGAKGRMGAEVVKAVSNASDLELVASIDQNDDFNIVKNSGAQVAVDFTTPDAVMKNLDLLIEAGISPVVGTTGFNEEKIVTQEVYIEKTPLDLNMPSSVEWRDFEFVVVTPDNYEEVLKELRDSGKSTALFALNEDSYENLSIVVTDMKRYMGEQKVIIMEYKNYYEKENKE